MTEFDPPGEKIAFGEVSRTPIIDEAIVYDAYGLDVTPRGDFIFGKFWATLGNLCEKATDWHFHRDQIAGNVYEIQSPCPGKRAYFYRLTVPPPPMSQSRSD